MSFTQKKTERKETEKMKGVIEISWPLMVLFLLLQQRVSHFIFLLSSLSFSFISAATVWENEIFAQLIYKGSGRRGGGGRQKRDNKSSQSVCFSLLESSDFIPRLVLSAIPNVFLRSRILYFAHKISRLFFVPPPGSRVCSVKS